jgi:hypothetical protein
MNSLQITECPILQICDYTLLEIAKFLCCEDLLFLRLTHSEFHNILTPFVKQNNVFTTFNATVAFELTKLDYKVKFFNYHTPISDENIKDFGSIFHLNLFNLSLNTLERLTDVKILHLKDCSIKNFGDSPNVENLRIDYAGRNFKTLDSFKNAKHIRLHNCDNLRSVEAIASANFVEIKNCQGKRYGIPIDLSPLNHATKLNYLI